MTRYVLVKKSGYYYEPTVKMRAAGLCREALGTDPIAANKRADQLNAIWDAIRKTGDVNAKPPARPGTVTALIEQLRGTDKKPNPEWRVKSQGRRDNLEFSFAVINDSPLGDTLVTKVTPIDCQEFYTALGDLGPTRRHDIYRDLRYLFNYAGRIRYYKMTKAENPTYVVKNEVPKARTQSWESEAVRNAIKLGWAKGYHGCVVGLAIQYDTSMRPGDVRTLPLEHLDLVGRRSILPAQSKTDNPHWTTLWPETCQLIERYLKIRGVVVLPGQPLIRTRSGLRYTKLQYARDVRAVKRLAGIPDDIQGRDLRRTAWKERAEAGVTALEGGAAAGQKTTSSQRIIDVYAPGSYKLAENAQTKRGNKLRVVKN